MGNNNYQFKLRNLDVLSKYTMELTNKMEIFNNFQFELANIHQKYADEGEWDDVKHTRFKDEHIDSIIKASEAARLSIAEACSRLNQLRSEYANAGVA